MNKTYDKTKPSEAIKHFCFFDCCCEDLDNYKHCEATTCALWEFRFGKNPYNKRNYTEEQRAKMSANLKANRRDRS